MPRKRRHIVITGTGRAGTTFLVELLSALELDTGFEPEQLRSGKSGLSQAGLEHDIRRPDCPFVVKSPWFCDCVEEVLRRDDLLIEHIFVPIRDLHAAAESRRQVSQSGHAELPFVKRLLGAIWPPSFDGGLWETSRRRRHEQEQVLLEKIYRLMLSASGHQVPVTLIQFPKLVSDGAYLYAKLKPVLLNIDYSFFRRAFERVARPELVHEFPAVPKSIGGVGPIGLHDSVRR